ncbi:UDP-N-acetylenolpyruvoylglucosamine reductase [Philodulcilactobacillus myokoensis]|uniref:UDP-N-acetylenolpyruvoylglucosamine reductase n=1 Tax=Philodulcilactobacillus myokoensis TaxID=2929573 RepID=A0A9W6B219_9LACO|nr:UDP-N-acetylmuramate dehydrogenase [Philodulcilactobacillus myokoensis]GLB47116.1 UDP-N-acetylenolpyruvoylglucosamine reductase [Philodulcilactobacillus myokoensis]
MESKLNDIKILKNEPLSHYTFTKTGGPAELLAFPKNVKELEMLVQLANKDRLPITVIGRASNLIIRDGGIHGLVISLIHLNRIRCVGNQIIADAGAAIIDASICAQKHSLSGLEFAAGIPGSVGGAIFMNAGAYGGSTDSIVDSVNVLSDGKIQTLNRDQLNFGYRHSIIQDQKMVVLSATFNLKPADSNQIQSFMDHINALRMSKQPLELPSCGSVFKRPTGYFTGKLIHDAHLQGYRSGGAEVSKKHAGFIVNVDHATADDYLNVIHHVQSVVYEQNQVKLHPEVRIIGNRNK